jgi:hypothetical protein
MERFTVLYHYSQIADHTALAAVIKELRRTASYPFRLTREGRYKSKAAFLFLLRNNNYNYNEIYTYHGYILNNDEIILPPSLLH